MVSLAPQLERQQSADWQRARQLVLRWGQHATAYQILNPGIHYWFAPDGQAVVGYVVAAGYRVVAGAPVCAAGELAQVCLAFEQATHAAALRVCYFGMQAQGAALLAAHPPTARLLLGAQPVWQPADWQAALARKASLRAQLRRARNKQVQVEPWSADQATNHPDLARCLHTWLGQRRLPPMHFMVEPATLDHLHDRQVFVATQHERVVGFLVASPIPARQGWLIEQIVRTRMTPNGTSELLLNTAITHLDAAGAQMITLGLAPLSRRAQVPDEPQPALVQLVLSWTHAHGSRFYNFAGLDAFKAKFLPGWWEPIYAVTRAPQISLPVLYAIAGAFGGTSPLVYISHSLLRAAMQEAAWAGQRVQRRLGRLAR